MPSTGVVQLRLLNQSRGHHHHFPQFYSLILLIILFFIIIVIVFVVVVDDVLQSTTSQYPAMGNALPLPYLLPRSSSIDQHIIIKILNLLFLRFIFNFVLDVAYNDDDDDDDINSYLNGHFPLIFHS